MVRERPPLSLCFSPSKSFVTNGTIMLHFFFLLSSREGLIERNAIIMMMTNTAVSIWNLQTAETLGNI